MRREHPRAPASKANPWKASGEPGWVKVMPKRCQVAPRRQLMLYAHPNEDGTVHLCWHDVRLGETLVVFGGVERPVVTWHRGAVGVDVGVDGHHVGRLAFANLPGPRWSAISTQQWAGQRADVELSLTTDDDRQRWTCLEALVLSSR